MRGAGEIRGGFCEGGSADLKLKPLTFQDSAVAHLNPTWVASCLCKEILLWLILNVSSLHLCYRVAAKCLFP